MAMEMDKRDKKETDGETQFIKEEHQQTRNYVFQKNKITKTAFLIIIVFLIILAIGLAVSGIFFEAPAINP
jgi:ABC-type lipoprotein release transport system permease subunit